MFCEIEEVKKGNENAGNAIQNRMEYLQKNLHLLRMFDIIQINDHIKITQRALC